MGKSKKKLKFFRDQIETHLIDSGLRGFVYLKNATSAYQRFIWVAVCLATTCLTYHDVYVTTMTFLEKPTWTKMIMHSVIPLEIPDLKICILLNNEEFGSFLRDDFNEKFLNDTKNNVVNFSHLYENFTDDFLSVYAKSRNFSYSPFLLFSMNLLIDLTKFEMPGNELDSHIRYDSAMRAFQTLFPPNLLDSSEVIRHVGAAVWQEMNFSIATSRDAFNFSPVQFSLMKHVSWLGQTEIPNYLQTCVAIPSNIMLFHDRLSYVKVQLDGKRLYGNGDSSFVFIYFGPDRFPFVFSENVFHVEKLKILFATIRKTEIYSSRPSALQDCSDDNSELECRLKCQAAYTYRRCACRPSFSAFLSQLNALKFCNFTEISKRNAACSYNVFMESVKHCGTQCLTICRRKLYTVDREYRGETDLVDLRFSCDSFIYPEFREVEAISFKQLLSQLGGNLSLWMGASFIALLHGCMFVIELPFLFVKYMRGEIS